MAEFYIKIRLSEDEKKTLTQYALEYGMTVTDYVKYCCITNKPQLNNSDSIVINSTDTITTEELFTLISKLIDDLPLGSLFTIKELLSEHWEKLNLGQRRQIGKIFNHQVTDLNLYPNIKFLRKRSDNHAEYKKF